MGGDLPTSGECPSKPCPEVNSSGTETPNPGAPTGAESAAREASLHWSVIRGNLELSKTLLDRGCPVDCTDRESMTPLHVAACRGDFNHVRLLLSRGADPSLSTKVPRISDGATGLTPLHFAAESTNSAVVGLIARAAPPEAINARDSTGATPLSIAAFFGDSRSVRLLLARGADPAVVSEDAMTPLDLAVSGYLQQPRGAGECLPGDNGYYNVFVALGEVAPADAFARARERLKGDRKVQRYLGQERGRWISWLFKMAYPAFVAALLAALALTLLVPLRMYTLPGLIFSAIILVNLVLLIASHYVGPGDLPRDCKLPPPGTPVEKVPICPSCLQYQRSQYRCHHCRVCNRCTPRFDHHCDWTGNCVGAGNAILFLCLLISTIVTGATALCFSIVFQIIPIIRVFSIPFVLVRLPYVLLLPILGGAALGFSSVVFSHYLPGTVYDVTAFERTHGLLERGECCAGFCSGYRDYYTRDGSLGDLSDSMASESEGDGAAGASLSGPQ